MEDYFSELPIGMWVRLGMVEALSAHLQKTGNPNAAWEGNFVFPGTGTLLMAAAEGGSEECLKLLLDAGARIDDQDERGWSALTHAAVHGEAGCEALLRQAGAAADLRHAVVTGDLELAKTRIGLGEEVDWRDLRGYTHLLEALSAAQGSMALFLLDHGADPAARALDGETGFTLGIRHRQEETCLRLFGYAEVLHVHEGRFGTLLMEALEWGLLEFGAKLLEVTPSEDLNQADARGRTALMWAAKHGDEALVERLLERGARPDILDSEGLDAAWWGSAFPAVRARLRQSL